MANIALIPGFATDTGYSVFRLVCGPDGGFRAFRGLVEQGEATVFRWGISKKAGFFRSMDPWFSWNLYTEERARTGDARTQQRFIAWLEQEQPQTIVCHSLGCRLLARTLQMHELPASVRTVIFNQGDLPIAELQTAMTRAPHIRFINTYCAWDPSLLFSFFTSRKQRVGLSAVPLSSLVNKHFPLWRPINPHTSAIRDGAFQQFCKEATLL